MKYFILIGFKSSGKTTLGRVLAQSLDLPFYDTDEMVLAKCMLTYPAVRDLVIAKGLQYFKAKESAVLAGLHDLPPGIVATGGGIIEGEHNRSLLHALGFCVFLNPSKALLWQRITADVLPTFLDKENPYDDFLSCYNRRFPLYLASANTVLDESMITLLNLEKVYEQFMRAE